MMSSKPHTKIPRQVFTSHVFFSLFAIVTLLVGLTWLSEKMRNEAFDNACLLKVNKAHSKLVISYLCEGNENLQELLERMQANQGFNYCSIIGAHGNIVAHSDPAMVGGEYKEPVGERTAYGEVEEVRFKEQSKALRQYSVVIKSENGSPGVLKVGLGDYGSWQFAMNMVRELPLVLILPLGLMFFGGLTLRRMIEPTADIQNQLSQLAVINELSNGKLQPVTVRNGASIGWNRLVDEFSDFNNRNGLSERLDDAVEELEVHRIHDLLESVPFGIAETDAEGKITFINRAMETLLGMDSEGVEGAIDAEGTQLKEYLELEPESLPFKQLLSERSLNRIGSAELKRESPSGERILKLTRQPLVDAETTNKSGAGASFQAWAARDITQLKLADRARDQFLDSATHEIRTPLSNIKAYAETLALCEMNDVEQQKEFCNIINGEATRLAKFIDDLLDVSSMEAGSLAIKSQRVDLARLLNEVILKVQPTMDQKNIDFSHKFDGKLPDINADKVKFSTCLINLLGNASKYTENDGAVSFRAHVLDKNLVIEVEDTGFGISEEDIERVFDKFFRSEDQRVVDETGTGLGLAFTHEVVRLHGGTLTVASELNKGSTFTVTLPLE